MHPVPSSLEGQIKQFSLEKENRYMLDFHLIVPSLETSNSVSKTLIDLTVSL